MRQSIKNQIIKDYLDTKGLSFNADSHAQIIGAALDWVEEHVPQDIFPLQEIGSNVEAIKNAQLTATSVLHEFLDKTLNLATSPAQFHANYAYAVKKLTFDVAPIYVNSYQLFERTNNLGIRELYTQQSRSQDTAFNRKAHGLTEIDVKRALIDFGFGPNEVKTLPYEANCLRAAIDKAKSDAERSNVSEFKIPMLLSMADPSTHSVHWIAATITVNTNKRALTYIITDSQTHSPAQKEKYEQMILSALIDQPSELFNAFPQNQGWTIDRRASNISHGKSKDAHLSGYSALHTMLSSANHLAECKNEIARNYAAISSTDVQSMVSAVYRSQLSELRLNQSELSVLSEQAQKNFHASFGTEAIVRSISMDSLNSFLDATEPLENKPTLELHAKITEVIEAFQSSNHIVSFPKSSKDKTIGASEYHHFLTEMQSLLSVKQNRLACIRLPHIDSRALDGISAFYASNQNCIVNTLIYGIALEPSEAKNEFLEKLKFNLLKLSQAQQHALSFEDSENKLSREDWLILLNFIKEKHVLCKINLPAAFSKTALQRDFYIAFESISQKANAEKLTDNELNSEQNVATTVREKKLRQRSQIDFSTTGKSTEIELQDAIEADVEIEVNSRSGKKNSSLSTGKIFSSTMMLNAIETNNFDCLEGQNFCLTKTEFIKRWHILSGTMAIGLIKLGKNTSLKDEALNIKRLVNQEVILGKSNFSGISEAALNKLMGSKIFPNGGIDYNNLPFGFMLLPSEEKPNSFILHYDEEYLNASATIKYDVSSKENTSEVNFSDLDTLIGKLSSNKPADIFLKKAHAHQLNKSEFSSEHYQAYKKIMLQLISLTDEQKSSLLSLHGIDIEAEQATELTDEELHNDCIVKLAAFFDLLPKLSNLYQEPFEKDNLIGVEKLLELYKEDDFEKIIQVANSIVNNQQSRASDDCLLFQLLNEETSATLRKAAKKYNLHYPQLQAMLALHGSYGDACIEKVLSIWQAIENLPNFDINKYASATQCTDDYLTVIQNDNLLKACQQISRFTGADKAWFEALYANHHPKEEIALSELVNQFMAFKTELNKNGFSLYDISSIRAPFTPGVSMSTAMARMLSILERAKPEERQAQWQVIAALNLSEVGAIKGLNDVLSSKHSHDAKELADHYQFILPVMGIEPQNTVHLTQDVYDPIYGTEWIGSDQDIESDEMRKLACQKRFFRFISAQKYRMPISFYLDAIEQIENVTSDLADYKESDQRNAKDILYRLLAEITSGEKYKYFIKNHKEAKLQWNSIVADLKSAKLDLNFALKSAAKVTFGGDPNTEIFKSIVTELGKLPNVPSLNVMAQLVSTLTNPIKNFENTPSLISSMQAMVYSNETLSTITRIYGDAIYNAMKHYNEADYTASYPKPSKLENTLLSLKRYGERLSLFDYHIMVCSEIYSVTNETKKAIGADKFLIPLISTFKIKLEDVPTLVEVYKNIYSDMDEESQNFFHLIVKYVGQQLENIPSAESLSAHDLKNLLSDLKKITPAMSREFKQRAEAERNSITEQLMRSETSRENQRILGQELFKVTNVVYFFQQNECKAEALSFLINKSWQKMDNPSDISSIDEFNHQEDISIIDLHADELEFSDIIELPERLNDESIVSHKEKFSYQNPDDDESDFFDTAPPPEEETGTIGKPADLSELDFDSREKLSNDDLNFGLDNLLETQEDEYEHKNESSVTAPNFDDNHFIETQIKANQEIDLKLLVIKYFQSNPKTKDAFGNDFFIKAFAKEPAGKVKSYLDLNFTDSNIRTEIDQLCIKFKGNDETETLGFLYDLKELLESKETDAEKKQLLEYLNDDLLVNESLSDIKMLLNAMLEVGSGSFIYYMQLTKTELDHKKTNAEPLCHVCQKAVFFIKNALSTFNKEFKHLSVLELQPMIAKAINAGHGTELTTPVNVDTTFDHFQALKIQFSNIKNSDNPKDFANDLLEQVIADKTNNAIIRLPEVKALQTHLTYLKKSEKERVQDGTPIKHEISEDQFEQESLFQPFSNTKYTTEEIQVARTGLSSWLSPIIGKTYTQTHYYREEIKYKEVDVVKHFDKNLLQNLIDAIDKKAVETQTYGYALKSTLHIVDDLIEKYPTAKSLVVPFARDLIGQQDAAANEDSSHIKHAYAQLARLKTEFDNLNDKDLVISLCEHFSGKSKPELTLDKLMQIFNGNEPYQPFKQLDSGQKAVLFKAICALLNNNKPCALGDIENQVELLAADLNHEYQTALEITYQKAPFPELSTLKSWWDAKQDITTQYARWSIKPVDRENIPIDPSKTNSPLVNGFDLTFAKSRSQEIGGASFSDQELEDLNHQVYDVQQKTTVQLLTEIAGYRNQANAHPTKEDYRRLVAVMAEVLYRTKGLPAELDENNKRKFGRSFEINSTQYLALYSLLASKDKTISGIGTGEGKSRIMMLSIACEWALGKTVDFVTADVSLATRDYLEYQAFFSAFGAETNLITAQTPAHEYRVDGINFSDPANLNLFRNKARSEGLSNKVIHNDKTKRCLLLDEADKTLYDTVDTRYNYSAQADKSINNMPWVYDALIEFFEDKQAYPSVTLDPNNFGPRTNEACFHGKFSDAEECNARFRHFIESKYGVDSNHVKRVDALSQEQLELWQRSALIALNFEYNKDFSLESNAAIVTKEGPKSVNQARFIDGGVASRTGKFSFGVHPLLNARLNRLQAKWASSSELPKAGTLEARLQEKDFKLSRFPIESENQIIYSSTSKAMTNDYGVIKGVSGTPGAEIERAEKENQFSFIDIPRHRGLKRIDNPYQICQDQSSQDQAILRNVLAHIQKNQPILLVCENDTESLRLASLLRANLSEEQCSKLNRVDAATSIEQEQEIVKKKAGLPHAITIATARLGRGTDIELHDAAKIGGLHVLGTYLPRTRDYIQIVGRAGRFGAEGSSQFIFNAEDFKTDGQTPFELITATEAYLAQQQELADVYVQKQRIIKDAVNDYRMNYTNAFFDDFYKNHFEDDSFDKDEMRDLWRIFFGETDKAWNKAWENITSALAVDNIDKVKTCLNEYEKEVQASWSTLNASVSSTLGQTYDGSLKTGTNFKPIELSEREESLLRYAIVPNQKLRTQVIEPEQYTQNRKYYENRAVVINGFWSNLFINTLPSIFSLLPFQKPTPFLQAARNGNLSWRQFFLGGNDSSTPQQTQVSLINLQANSNEPTKEVVQDIADDSTLSSTARMLNSGPNFAPAKGSNEILLENGPEHDVSAHHETNVQPKIGMDEEVKSGPPYN